jgi:GrpB-like predicted nucleotidyltransferase (UPF0157 family)
VAPNFISSVAINRKKARKMSSQTMSVSSSPYDFQRTEEIHGEGLRSNDQELMRELSFADRMDSQRAKWFYEVLRDHPEIRDRIKRSFKIRDSSSDGEIGVLMRAKGTSSRPFGKNIGDCLEVQSCTNYLCFPYFETREQLEIVMMAI